MSKIDDGGPAFPRPASIDPTSGTLPDGDRLVDQQDGMTLRDYFAAAALTGLIASHTGAMPIPPRADAAEVAYEYADAMLTARQKERPR